MEKRTLSIVTGSFLIALSIVLSTLLITNTLKQIKFGRGKIEVKGCAEKEISSDLVKLDGSISTTAETLVDAYERLEKDQKILTEYLVQQGISLNDVAFSSIRTSNIYEQSEKGHFTNKIESYQLFQDFTITSFDIPLITELSKNITSLIKEGLTITSYTPSYFYLNINELKIEMLNEAAKDAYQRADALVTTTGSSVGKITSAHQGVFQITPAASTTVSDYGENDTSSIVKRIKAVVTMEYEIKN